MDDAGGCHLRVLFSVVKVQYLGYPDIWSYRLTISTCLLRIDHEIKSNSTSLVQHKSTDGTRTESRSHESPAQDNLTCIALATGLKCLPHSKHPNARGAILHDSHAEILALRAFNRFILDECRTLAQPQEPGSAHPRTSPWVRWRTSSSTAEPGNPPSDDGDDGEDRDGNPPFSPPFELHDGIGIHMFCSELPCGDASMELTMSEQVDAAPWTSSSPVLPLSPDHNPPSPSYSPLLHSALQSMNGERQNEERMLGRGHFDRLGIVRRKPSRPDAPLALSKSCSDKLALKQCTGILSGLVSLLLHPERCYIDTLVVPKRGYAAAGMERAFGMDGRMRPVLNGEARGKLRDLGFSVRPFEVRTTDVEFELAKRVIGDGAIPSNLSAVYTPHRQELLCNGVLQGRKQFDLRGASCLSRRRMWKDTLDLVSVAGIPALMKVLDGGKSYADLKACRFLKGREYVKAEVRREALKGWKRNLGDEAWHLDHES